MQPDAATIDAWQHSRFGQCHRQAKQAPHEKRPWATEDILDLEDFINGNARHIRAVARREFQSLPRNPHTKMIDISMGEISDGMDVPQTAMLSILQSCLHHLERDLTKRQREAVAVYDEAIDLEQPPIVYVARKLGITKQAASQIIKRAKMFTFDDFVAYINRENTQADNWHPSPKQITAMMKSRPRICAHCGGQTYDGSVPLCFTCHSLLGSLREETWPQRTRAWLVPEINRIRREHREWAINELYLRHYGTVELDNPDVYQAAA